MVVKEQAWDEPMFVRLASHVRSLCSVGVLIASHLGKGCDAKKSVWDEPMFVTYGADVTRLACPHALCCALEQDVRSVRPFLSEGSGLVQHLTSGSVTRKRPRARSLDLLEVPPMHTTASLCPNTTKRTLIAHINTTTNVLGDSNDAVSGVVCQCAALVRTSHSRM